MTTEAVETTRSTEETPVGNSGDEAAGEHSHDERGDESDYSEADSRFIEQGDFVRIENTVRKASDGQVIDTTREEMAIESGLAHEERELSPRLIVVGDGHVFRPVEEDLVGRTVGAKNVVTVPAEEAFGRVDPHKMRIVKIRKISPENLYPGAQVEIGGEQGYVLRLMGSRAYVDFNHPWAGEDLEYEYEIVDIVEDRIEKARGLLGIYFHAPPEIRVRTDEVEVEADTDAAGDEDEETGVRTRVRETLYIEATPVQKQWLLKRKAAQQLKALLDFDRVIIEGDSENLRESDDTEGTGAREEEIGSASDDTDSNDLVETPETVSEDTEGSSDGSE